MKTIFAVSRRFAALVAALAAAAPTLATAAPAPLDHLFIGDHIITMAADFRAEAAPTALGVRGERIVWVGDASDAAAHRGPGTVVHRLGDQALLPGFIDAHGHLTFLAATLTWANLAPPPVGPVTDFATLQRELRAYIDDNAVPAGVWVIGYGYDDSLLKERAHPDRHVLDAVSRSHPIALLHVSGHLMAASSLALETAGIDAESADPAGGHIRREGDGRTPSGVLEETATYPLRGVLAAPKGNPIDDLSRALDHYASHGITTVQDGATGPAQIDLLEAAATAGRLTLDVVAYPVVDDGDLSRLDDVDFGPYHNRLRLGGVKLILDGSPQGKTAYLSTPYREPPAGQPASYRGYPIHRDGTVDALLSGLLARGIPVLAHANGDAAAQQLIDAVAQASGADGDHRTVMIHAQTVRDDQLDRMAQLGIVPSYFSAHSFFWGDWHRDSVLGPERAFRISPARSTLARGMPFTVHNDAPVVPPDMIRLLWATTNRRTRSGQLLGDAERIGTLEALAAMTRHAAFQYFEEDHKGTLAEGKLADLVVLSADPLSLPPADLLELQVRQTWSRGRQVHGAP